MRLKGLHYQDTQVVKTSKAGQCDFNVAARVVALDGDAHLVADLPLLQRVIEIVGRVDFLAVDGDDYVAKLDLTIAIASGRLQTSLCGRTVRQNVDDEHAGLHAGLASQLILSDVNAHAGPNHLAAADQLRHDAIDRIDRDGETDARVGAGRAVYSGVDADQQAGAIQQRSTGIAGIDRRVGLDHAANGPLRYGLDLAAQGADDAGGQRLVQAERIADGEYFLAYLEVFRHADQKGVEAALRCIDFEHGKVVVGRTADNRRPPGVVIGERA